MTGGPTGFWDSTPRILSIAVEGALERARSEHQRAAWAAWTTAVLGRVKDIPSLDSLLHPSKPKQKSQTWQQQLAAAEVWTASARSMNGG